jgi:hypothetical protein
MTRVSLPIIILVMLLVSPLFFSMTEVDVEGNTVLKEQYQISQEVNCATTPNINCRIDREIYEGLTYRDIFDQNNLAPIINQEDFDNNWQLGGSSSGVDKSYQVIDNQILMFHGTTDVSSNRNFRVFTPVIQSSFENAYISFSIKGELANAGNFRFYARMLQDSSFLNQIEYLTLNHTVFPQDFEKYSFVVIDLNEGNQRILHFHEDTGTTSPDRTSEIVLKNLFYINLDNFNTQPTKQQLDQWLQFYLQHKDQGIVNDFYHIDSQEFILLGKELTKGIDSVIDRTDRFIEFLTLDLSNYVYTFFDFVGDPIMDFLEGVGLIENTFVWWAEFNQSLPTWARRILRLE